jgi:ATP-dependent protease ClpP protease subunit
MMNDNRNRERAAGLLRQMAAACRDRTTATILIEGQITSALECRVRGALDRESRSAKKILLAITSRGGLVTSARSIARDVGELGKAGIEIESLAGVECASAAVELLAIANYRGAREDCQFLIHGGAIAEHRVNRLTAPALRQLAGTLEQGDNAMLDLLAKSSGARLPPFIPWAVARGRDVVLSAYEMMAIGLVHYVRPAWEVDRIFARARKDVPL